MIRILWLFVLSIFIVPGLAQKKVVIEKFTNSSCGSCPDAALFIEELVEEFPNLIWVSHQKTHGWRENPLANEVSWALWQEVNTIGNPTAMIDREIVNGLLVSTRSSWRDKIIEQLNEPEVVTLDISKVKFDTGTRELRFEVDAKFLDIPVTSPMRLTAMIVQDSVWGEPQDNYNNNTPGHPHEGKGEEMWNYAHRNVVRTILDDHWGSSDFFPANPVIGETYNKSYSYIIPEDHREMRHKIVCFVSDHGTTLSERKIFNATETKLRSVDLTLSGQDLISDLGIKISPNPVSERLHVNSSVAIDKVFIYNASGELVYMGSPAGNEHWVSVRSYVEGIYFLEIETNGKRLTQKFIIKK